MFFTKSKEQWLNVSVLSHFVRNFDMKINPYVFACRKMKKKNSNVQKETLWHETVSTVANCISKIYTLGVIVSLTKNLSSLRVKNCQRTIFLSYNKHINYLTKVLRMEILDWNNVPKKCNKTRLCYKFLHLSNLILPNVSRTNI